MLVTELGPIGTIWPDEMLIGYATDDGIFEL
jgi:hypothetical protein